MNKITEILFALFLAILIWQSGCVTNKRSEIDVTSSSTTQTPMVPPAKTPSNVITDLKTSELEAQTLLDSGITFGFTLNAGGVTEDGGLYTGHGYVSSDGVEISTSRGLYRQEKNAKKDCEDAQKETDKILKKEQIDDGKRVVATKKAGGFLVAIRSGNGCYIYDSPSLKHLLAFEKWRDK